MVFICALLVGSASVWAATTEQTGRFTMRQTENGMLRLDTLTGDVSACAIRNGSWVCERVSDDSPAADDRLQALADKNRKLRAEVDRLRAELAERPADGATGTQNRRNAIPNEEDIDKAFSFVERMLKKFKDMVEDLNDKQLEGTPL